MIARLSLTEQLRSCLFLQRGAREFTDTPIYVKASTQASDTIALHDRRSLTTIDATVVATERAFKMAGLSRSDIDVAEVHDRFTIAEIMAIEDLGFFEKGQGGPATIDGETAIGGKVVINTSGGLKACGHPVGATGIKQAVEIVEQIRGEVGRRQVDEAEVGLTHNVGGTPELQCCTYIGEVTTMSVARFWRKIPSRYNLVGTKCETCNTYYFPPRLICPP